MASIDQPMPEDAPEDSKRVKKKPRRAVKQTIGLCRRTFKKKDGTLYEGNIWYMRYSAPDPKNPGKMKKVFESCGTDNKTKAEEILIKRKAMVLTQTHPELRSNNEMSFKEFVNDHYLPACHDQAGIQAKTNVCKALIEVFGNYNLSDITAKMVAAYRTAREKKGNAQGTINRHFTALKNIFTVAHTPEHNLVSAAKLADIRSVKKKAEDEGRINYLSKAQVKELLKAAEGSYMHQIIRWSINTGIRRGRTFKLTWDMVDIESEKPYVHIPKDKHGRRFDAPLNKEALVVLKERLAVKRPDVPYVFYSEKSGTRWYDVKKPWLALTKQAKITGVNFHDMRHTFISWCVMSGVDIRTVQELAGHKSLDMTLKYSHLAPDHVMQAVNLLSYEIKEPETTTEAPVITQAEALEEEYF